MSPRRRKKRSLTEEDLDRLLAHLDEDREVAAEKYLTLHSKLVKFFEGRACPYPEDHAHDTLSLVALKLRDEKIDNITTYAFGIARNLFMEILRDIKKEQSALNYLRHFQPESEDQMNSDLRLECFNACLQSLPDESRELLINYYKGDKQEKIENRRRLAQSLGVPLNVLRIRVHRLRAKLEKRVNDCVDPKVEE